MCFNIVEYEGTSFGSKDLGCLLFFWKMISKISSLYSSYTSARGGGRNFAIISSHRTFRQLYKQILNYIIVFAGVCWCIDGIWNDSFIRSLYYKYYVLCRSSPEKSRYLSRPGNGTLTWWCWPLRGRFHLGLGCRTHPRSWDFRNGRWSMSDDESLDIIHKN